MDQQYEERDRKPRADLTFEADRDEPEADAPESDTPESDTPEADTPDVEAREADELHAAAAKTDGEAEVTAADVPDAEASTNEGGIDGDETFAVMRPLELDLADARLLDEPEHDASPLQGAQERARRRAEELALEDAYRAADELELEARLLRETARQRAAERAALLGGQAADDDDEQPRPATLRRTLPPPIPPEALRSVEILPPPIQAARSLSVPPPPPPADVEDLTLELEETTVQPSLRTPFDGQPALPPFTPGAYKPAAASVRPGPSNVIRPPPRSRPVLAPLAALAAGAAAIAVVAFWWLPRPAGVRSSRRLQEPAAQQVERRPELIEQAPSALPPAPVVAPELPALPAAPLEESAAQQLERRRLAHEQRRAARHERRRRARERAYEEPADEPGGAWDADPASFDTPVQRAQDGDQPAP